MICIEVQQPDLLEPRIKSFKKRFKKRLVDLKKYRVIPFLKLIQRYFGAPRDVVEDHFLKRVEGAFEWKTAAREDIFVMSVYAYLNAKTERKSIYQASLELVNPRHTENI